MIKLILSRYALFSIMGVEGLLLPNFFSPAEYASIEYWKYLAFLMQFSLLGIGTGYVKSKVSCKSSSERQEVKIYFCITVLLFCVAGGISFYLLSGMVVAVLYIIGVAMVFIESDSKAEESYLLAMSFKPILSAVLIFVACVLTFNEASFYFAFAFGLAGIIHLAIYCKLLPLKAGVIDPLSCSKWFVTLKSMIRHGFVINVSTLILFYYLFSDRTYIKENFPDMLPTYSLAFVITQLALTAVTAFSYVNLVEFGKSGSKGLLKKFKNTMIKTTATFLLFGAGAVLIAYCADLFYGYSLLLETSLLMITFYGGATLFMSTNAIFIYLGKTHWLLGMFFLILFASQLSKLVLERYFSLEYWSLLLSSYGILLIGTVAVFIVSYVCLSRREY